MLHTAKSYIKYKRNATGKHGVHSPFVFDLMRQVFDASDTYYDFKPIELLRGNLKLNSTKIKITDMGAGSKTSNSSHKTIAQIVKSASKNPKYGQLLFRLANYFEVKNVLELGTSLGISTAYLAKARKTAEIITLEGDKEIAKYAKQNFKTLRIKNVSLIEGNFNETLPRVLENTKSIDFVFFDGNHTEKSTLNYFEQCLQKKHNNTIFVFDDIYWSKGMTKAWETIKTHKDVTLTIDVFEMGIVFFRTELQKKNYIIKY